MLQHPKSTPTKLDNDGPTVLVVEDSRTFHLFCWYGPVFVRDQSAAAELVQGPQAEIGSSASHAGVE
jgi:hypothetical protein